MTPGRLLRWIAFSLLLVVPAVSACGGDDRLESPPSSTAATVDVSTHRQRLGEDIWAQIDGAEWLDGNLATPDGARLLEAVASSGPLASQERKLALLSAHPGGLTEEALSSANQFARMAVRDLHDVLDAAWLLDGIDEYERAVFAAISERTVSPPALKLAIEERLFADLHETDPKLLTSRRIDALGSLSPQLLARAEQEAWFQDGLDDYDVSLLGILADMVQVEDAIEILDTGSYRPLRSGDTTLAVVLVGPSASLQQQGYVLIERWFAEVAAFAGEFYSIGLILDVTPVPGDPFCHGNGGNQYSVGFISLTSNGCFQSGVAVHELAHAFIGGRYPAWFSEGVAELVTKHVLGDAAGYRGGSGVIDLEGYYFVGSSVYLNQASLGADFLGALYEIAPRQAMSQFVRDVAGQRLSGSDVLARIRAIEGVDRAGMERLVRTFFGAALPPASSGVPAATPPPANR